MERRQKRRYDVWSRKVSPFFVCFYEAFSNVGTNSATIIFIVVVDSDGDGKISYNEFVSLMMLSAHEDDSG